MLCSNLILAGPVLCITGRRSWPGNVRSFPGSFFSLYFLSVSFFFFFLDKSWSSPDYGLDICENKTGFDLTVPSGLLQKLSRGLNLLLALPVSISMMDRWGRDFQLHVTYAQEALCPKSSFRLCPCALKYYEKGMSIETARDYFLQGI